MDYKIYCRCKVNKPIGDFQHRTANKGRVSSACRKCISERLAYFRHHPDHKDRFHRYRRNSALKTYGLTVDDYNKLLSSQKGGCAICGSPTTTGFGKYLAVDHDHNTNKVRGLLCNDCNTGLGVFKEDITTIKAAIAYLRKHKP